MEFKELTEKHGYEGAREMLAERADWERKQAKEEPAEPLFHVIENLVQYDISASDAERLVKAGMLVKAEGGDPLLYDTTAYVWDDLGLDGEDAFGLFDRILGRWQG